MRAPAEYVWIDEGEAKSKTVMIEIGPDFKPDENTPDWDTEIAGETNLLRPIYFCEDPVRNHKGVVLLTEAFLDEQTPAKTNKRAVLRMQAAGEEAVLPVFVSQQYGIGATKSDKVLSSKAHALTEMHLRFCNEIGLGIEYYDASQAGTVEYGIDLDPESGGPVYTADQVWISRWLLVKAADLNDVKVRFDKPYSMKVEILKLKDSGAHDTGVVASEVSFQADEDPYAAMYTILAPKEKKNERAAKN